MSQSELYAKNVQQYCTFGESRCQICVLVRYMCTWSLVGTFCRFWQQLTEAILTLGFFPYCSSFSSFLLHLLPSTAYNFPPHNPPLLCFTFHFYDLPFLLFPLPLSLLPSSLSLLPPGLSHQVLRDQPSVF